MAIKVVTGAPGSGKSYYVMREVVTKRFEWDNEFHEWKPKNHDKFTIFTNIDGLKLPHEKLEKHWKENGITFREFFTTKYIRQLTEKIGPVVIILDEAQKYFSRDFKDSKEVTANQDFENSVFYFFEYHRHLSVDVYLLAQMWTRMNPQIVGLCEYQIDAVRRSFRLGNEFRYNFLNGMEKIGGAILRSDKKIFALYSSFEGDEENKGKQVNPTRKYAVLCLVGIVAVLIAFKIFFASFGPEAVAETPRPTGAGEVEGKRPPEGPPEETQVHVGAENVPTKIKVTLPDDPQVSRVRLGGMWVGKKLIAIDLFGNVLSVKDFPFAFTHDQGEGSVYAMLPDVYLAKIKRDIDTVHAFNQERQQKVAQVYHEPLKDDDLNEYITQKAQREAMLKRSKVNPI